MPYQTEPHDVRSDGQSHPRDLDVPVRRPVEYAHGHDYDNRVGRIDRAVAAIENELELYRPPPKPEPMPDYVEPRDNVPPVGALSAEAIVKDFEKTAKGIEALAAELAEAANRCAVELVTLTRKYEDLGEEVKAVVEHVKETAAAYRDEAKTVFVRIEDTTLRMQEVRKMSDAMRERLAPTGSAALLPTVAMPERKEDESESPPN